MTKSQLWWHHEEQNGNVPKIEGHGEEFHKTISQLQMAQRTVRPQFEGSDFHFSVK